jgi:RecB family exonuclease
VITPRQTTLLRTPDLKAFQRAIAASAARAGHAGARAAVVSSQSAAVQLRRVLGPTPIELVTRSGLYDLLRRRLAVAPRLLTEFEREVLFRAAARHAVEGGAAPPFVLRPGLIAEMARFYDGLMRQHRTLEQLERLFVEELEASADIDRGAERLLRQTRFLVATFRHYSAALSAMAAREAGPTDEHGLRQMLCQSPAPDPLRHLIVTVPDRSADAAGLWLADFDLLTRLPDLERIDVIATEAVLATGFHERLHEVLPDISEERCGADSPPPVLHAPDSSDGALHFLSRDREDELAEVAGRIAARAQVPERVAIVFQRPLPYLYLARQLLEPAGLAYQAQDATPLAVEPFAAAVDLIFSAVTSGFGRAPLVELLASPHFQFGDDTGGLTRREVVELSRALQEDSYAGGVDRLEAVARAWSREGAEGRKRPGGHPRGPVRAARVAAGVARELSGLAGPAPGGVLLERLTNFMEARASAPPDDPEIQARHLRAKSAVVTAIAELRAAYEQHEPSDMTLDEVAASLRRWIEAQTFSPRLGEAGIHLVDAQAARYGDFDEVHVVGLVQEDWPPSPQRNVFYPLRMLRHLAWPAERDRIAGERAAFYDLLHLPRQTISLSSVLLESESIASPSPFLEQLEDVGLVVERRPAEPRRPSPGREVVLDGSSLPDRWARVREGRTPPGVACFHGAAGPRPRAAYTVTSVETYLRCPFKYFAAHVLRIDEERGDQLGLAPLERGRFVHDLLREFYEAWHAQEGGAITPDRIEKARALFTTIADRRLIGIPEAERGLERLRLLGSAVSGGVADVVIRAEAEQPVPVVDRLLEHAIDGEWQFESGHERRRVRIRGTFDRLDLLADSTFRLIDYKTGRVHGRRQAIQLPVYTVVAEQALAGRRGGPWKAGDASYLAFGEAQPTVRLARRPVDLAAALAEGQARFLDAIAGIESGDFPPRPSDASLCETCAYVSICRRDFVAVPDAGAIPDEPDEASP